MAPPREPELSLDLNPAGAGPFWTRSLAETIERLGASERGLSSDEARAGLARWGPNELRPPRRFDATPSWGACRYCAYNQICPYTATRD